MKIAWGITGAGHYLPESIEMMEEFMKQGNHVDIFLSEAAERVMEMYGVYNRVLKLHDLYKNEDVHIYYDKSQRPAYPICARFNLHYYDCLIISPLTANSVAKINVGIADTLITNIFAQMIKGSGNVYAIPCDVVAGEVETQIPNGDKIKIHIDEFNANNARAIAKFPHVKVFTHPQELAFLLKQK